MSFLHSKEFRRRNNLRNSFSGMESLEDRRLMAADVSFSYEITKVDLASRDYTGCTASVTITAEIQGTNANDQVLIYQFENDGEFIASVVVKNANGQTVNSDVENVSASLTATVAAYTESIGYTGLCFSSGTLRWDIHGGGGNDVIDGRGLATQQVGFAHGGGFTNVYAASLDADGGEGNDKLFGNDLEYMYDHLHGGVGDDWIHGGGGHGLSARNRLYGDIGNDTIIAGNGASEIWGGQDDDIIVGSDNIDHIYGGDGIDSVYGGNGGDLIYGGAGDDNLHGEAGNDQIWGGTDDDFLYGGDGGDVIRGESGNDQIWGGDHEDYIHGGDDDDILHGDSGNDTVFGNAGDDIIYGDAGGDFLFGGDDDDELIGGGGYDLVSGENGQDTLNGEAKFGGPGADIFWGWYGNKDYESAEGDYLHVTVSATVGPPKVNLGRR